MQRRILVVDDDPGVRGAFKDLLEKSGCEVRTHDSGFGLIVTARSFEPDVLLLDVEMPGLRGDAAWRAIRGLGRLPFDPPSVILISGLAASDLAQRAQACGAHDFLTKPVSGETLCSTIARVIAEREAASR